MAHLNKVLRSINTSDGAVCVDIFVRSDESFGFEEYRRDVEDGRGWFPIGFHGHRRFSSQAEAEAAAMAAVGWLDAL